MAIAQPITPLPLVERTGRRIAGEGSRSPELDALRLLVIFGLIPIHSAQIFASFFDFWVDGDNSYGFSIFMILAAFWAMPLLFLTSGMALWHALRKRSPGEFVRERVKRLVVPFLFGMAVVVPFLVYVEQVTEGYTGSIWAYLARYFDIGFAWDVPYFVDTSGDDLFEAGHLYFVYLLFVYSLILLPVLRYLRSDRGMSLRARITDLLVRPAALVLMVVPVATIQGLHEVEDSGGWSRWVYFVCVAYGCLIASDRRIMQAIASHRRAWLVIAVVATIALFPFGSFLDGQSIDAFKGREALAMAWRVGMGISGWFIVLAILGGAATAMAGRRALGDIAGSGGKGRLARLGAYAQDAVLPVYILHMAAVVGVAYFVVQWSVPTLVRYGVIVASSFAVTMVLFEIVRRNPVTRFLLGIKSRERREAAVWERP